MFNDKFLAKKLVEKWNQTFKQNLFKIGNKQISIDYIKLFGDALKEQGANENILVDQNIETINFNVKTDDSFNINTSVYLNKKSKKWLIGMHGYSSSKESVLYLVWIYYKLGYNICVFDFRNHGLSDKNFVSFGLNEQKDLKAVIKHIKNNYDVKHIGLFGASMGAFTLNYFASENDKFIKKHKIKFGISDSMYSSIYKVFQSFCKVESPLLSKFMDNIIEDALDIYKEEYKIDLRVLDLELKFNSKLKSFPILFLHSKEDKITNYKDSINTFELRKKIKIKDEIKIFSTGQHIKLLLNHTDEYIAITSKFIEKF